MGKKVSIGAVVALVAITAAITFTLSYQIAMRKFNETVADVNERQQMYSKLSAIDQRVRQNYLGEIDETKLTDSLCNGYLAGLADSKGQYLSAEKYKEYLAGSSERSVGIGVETIQDDDGNMEVVAVLPGSPAEQEGIQKGDVIIKVGGKDVKRIGYADALSKLDGAVGSSVELELLRSETIPAQEEGQEELTTLKTLTFTLVREEYTRDYISVHMIHDSIGYLSISQFNSQMIEDFQKAVEELISQGVTGFIFDVRNNSGGDVESVGKILDYLLPAGNLIGTVDREGTEEFIIQSDSRSVDLPMAVLSNSGTFGPSELFVSAMKDYKKNGIIGETTAGRGTQDKVFPMTDGSAIIISIANYITMNGEVFTDIGVEPTTTVALTDDQRSNLDRKSLSEDDDPQIQAAITYLGGRTEESSSSEEEVSSQSEDLDSSEAGESLE